MTYKHESSSLLARKKAKSSDRFYTELWAFMPLVKYLEGKTVLDPACGDKRMQKLFENFGIKTIGTDIESGDDFISPLFWPEDKYEFDVIVTNPPYSIKDKWLKRCYEIGKPFALLLPITALGEQERIRMYKQYGIQLLLLNERVNFETPSGEGAGSWFFASWFCWHLLPESICFSDALPIENYKEELPF